jgi:diguanylate cyclase (GGDEF)-like protein/PAS domain S-box-containing protein
MTTAAETASDLKQKALQVSESRYRRLFETAQDGILLLNAVSAQIEDVNPYLIKMLGYTHAEFLGKKLWEVGAFADVARSKEIFAELQTAGFVRYENLPLTTKAGASIDVEFVSNAYDCDNIKVIQCNIRNITDRIAAEAHARLHTRLYAALSECNKAIVHCANADELFKRVCQIAVKRGGMRMAWIGLLDLESSWVRPVASFGDDTGFLQDMHVSVNQAHASGRGPIATAIRNDRAAWSEEFANDPIGATWRERRTRFGFLASGSLPLHKGSAVIGALTLYAGDAAVFDEFTRAMLLEMAADMSFALAGFDREAHRKQTEAALLESEAQLSYTEKLSQTGGWTVNLKDHTARRTRQHDRIFGYPTQLPNWTRDTFLSHVIPEERADADLHLREFEADRLPLDFECRIRRVDGALRWIRTVADHERDETGSTLRISGIVQDITERKNVAQELLEIQQRLQGVLNSATDAILTADDQGTIVLNNPAAARMFGYEPQQLPHRPLNTLMPERFRAAQGGNIAMFGESGATSRDVGSARVAWGLRSNGEEFPIEVSISVDHSTGRPLYTAIVRDITERERNAVALQESRDRLMLATKSANMGIWDWDVLANHLVWDARMYELYGISPADFSGAYSAGQMGVHPDDVAGRDAAIAAALNGNQEYNIEFRVVRPDGEVRHIEGHAIVQRTADGLATRMIGVNRDITQRKLAEKRITYLNRVFAVMSGINSLIVRVSNRSELFREACGVAVKIGGFRMSLIGLLTPDSRNIEVVASAGKDDELLAAVKTDLVSPGVASRTMMARAIRSGKPVVANNSQTDAQVLLGKRYADRGVRSIAVLPLIVANKAIGAIVMYASEVEFFHTEELKLLTELAGDIAFAVVHLGQQERLEYLAYFDELTELPNRTQFIERVGRQMASASEAGHRLAALIIDLERFRNINGSLGREAGDLILKQVAHWLTQTVGDASLLARVGPDQFALAMPAVTDDAEVAQRVGTLVDAFLQHPFHLNEAVFRIAVRVGVALFPDDGTDADTLVRHADAALKSAKVHGVRYLLYTRKMTEALAGKLKLETQLQEALEKGEFVLHYQPKVNLASGRVTGAEALMRWNDPRTGLVPPGRFIPVLEETGLIYEAGRWALRTAVEDYLGWRAAGLVAVPIAVNVSPLQLRDQGFIAEIERAIGVDAHAAAGLELEITESLIMEDVKHGIALLKRIRALGVTIAIDDFGTGFSSLSYLAKLPVDTLKIDRSFIMDMSVGADGVSLVSTIVSLAHAMKLKVVAEGVETAEQSRLLQSVQCDEIQGFLFSRPVPRQIFEAQFLRAPAARENPGPGRDS